MGCERVLRSSHMHIIPDDNISTYIHIAIYRQLACIKLINNSIRMCIIVCPYTYAHVHVHYALYSHCTCMHAMVTIVYMHTQTAGDVHILYMLLHIHGHTHTRASMHVYMYRQTTQTTEIRILYNAHDHYPGLGPYTCAHTHML